MNGTLCVILIIAAFAGGFVLHVWLAKEYVATKTELATWQSRLRLAISQDEKSAKAAVEKIATEFENRF